MNISYLVHLNGDGGASLHCTFARNTPGACIASNVGAVDISNGAIRRWHSNTLSAVLSMLVRAAWHQDRKTYHVDSINPEGLEKGMSSHLGGGNSSKRGVK